jgi:hypothetical protein
MFPIRPGQYRHLLPHYQKMAPTDLNSFLESSPHPRNYSNTRLKYVEAGLEPYAEALTDAHLVHFIKRTRFGATFSMYPPGRYILRVMDGYRRSTFHLIKL